MVAVAQTRGIAPSLLVSPTEAVRTGPPPRHRRIVVSPSAAGLDTVVVPYNGRGLCNSLHGMQQARGRAMCRELWMRCRERLHGRDDQWRRVVLRVEGERHRHTQGTHAADEGAIPGGAAEVAQQLDAARQGVLLDAEAVAGQATGALRRGQVEHLAERCPIAEQAALEQRVEEPGQVSDGG